jgi:hypothetical protein
MFFIVLDAPQCKYDAVSNENPLSSLKNRIIDSMMAVDKSTKKRNLITGGARGDIR